MRRTTGKMRRTTGDGCRQTTKNRYRTSSIEIESEALPESCGKEEEDIGLVFCGRRHGSGVRERGVNRLRASCSDWKPPGRRRPQRRGQSVGRIHAIKPTATGKDRSSESPLAGRRHSSGLEWRTLASADRSGPALKNGPAAGPSRPD